MKNFVVEIYHADSESVSIISVTANARSSAMLSVKDSIQRGDTAKVFSAEKYIPYGRRIVQEREIYGLAGTDAEMAYKLHLEVV